MIYIHLNYLSKPVEADFTDTLYFPSMDRLVFLTRFLYMKKGPPHSYYGTFSSPLPEEFWEVEIVGIEFEQKLLRALTILGVIKGIASPFPLAQKEDYGL